jgi:hypothetical protein
MAFTSTGGCAIFLLMTGGNAFGRVVLESVVVPTDSIVIFLRVVVCGLRPAVAVIGG